ncbi:hypothetical protein L1887_39400 [Cichorium endivia]|nr:hypothetical protein L1887_39400 [Cichorium endivia]
MAEANPKPHPHDGDDPPNKRQKTSSATGAGGSPPRNHPDESSASNELEIEDTATSKPMKEEIKEVEIDDIDLMEEILEYRIRKRQFPSKSSDDLRRFCNGYIHLGIGNLNGWIKKMNEMKNKFNSDSDPTEDIDKKEFELWKKIWGNDRNGDDDPGVGSSK